MTRLMQSVRSLFVACSLVFGFVWVAAQESRD